MLGIEGMVELQRAIVLVRGVGNLGLVETPGKVGQRNTNLRNRARHADWSSATDQLLRNRIEAVDWNQFVGERNVIVERILGRGAAGGRQVARALECGERGGCIGKDGRALP